MNVIGLNDLMLRSLTTTYTENNGVFGASLFLFKGNVPNSFQDLNMDLSQDSVNEIYKSLMALSGAVTDLVPSVVRESGKVRLKLNNGAFAHSRIKTDWFKPKSTQAVYSFNTNAWTTLGDMILYYPTNVASVAWAAPGLPAAVTEEEIYSNKSRVFYMGALAHKTPLFYGHTYAMYFGHRNFSSSSNYGGGSVRFQVPVDADFIIMQIDSNTGGGAQASAAVQYLNMSDQWVTVPNSAQWMGVRNLHGWSFPKTKIKGVRSWSQNTTQASPETHHITTLTAGLKDYASDPKFNPPTTDNYTYGILLPNEDSVARASASRKPLMLVSLGVDETNDIRLVRNAQYQIDSDLFVANQTLLELDY